MQQDDLYTAEIEAAALAPGRLVFLCGPQRSGTTLLHRMLVATGSFRYVSAFDVMAYDELVHAHRSGAEEERRAAMQRTLSALQGHRGIDSSPVGADVPEEYGLLLTRGRLRIGAPDLGVMTFQPFRTLLGKKALIEGTSRPLLLKNPPDYRAIVWKLRAFPRARFIILHRHPLAVLRSQLRAWRALLARRNPYLALLDSGYSGLFRAPRAKLRLEFAVYSPAGATWLAEELLAGHSAALSVMEDGSPSFLVVRYEELVARPQQVIRRVCAFLDVEAQNTEGVVPGGRPSLPLDLADSTYAAMRESFAPYLARLGYHAEPHGGMA